MAEMQIQADPAKLRKIAGDVGSCHKNLLNNLQSSKSQVDSLKGVWTGEAATTFSSSFQKLLDKCDESLKTVAKLENALYESADSYERNEKAVQNEASKLPKLPNNMMR
ncbi:WXG100 family type VII secretion target [Kineothrix alysoides]|uniref:ESAT-6-like protein n=1 Tax=Kineothrix alysoides TaxID=1469948 RepID=A0A4R1R152_9FIRM|nr:WXG100 family type VII secretion target [Kineothrix alysoides]TCL59036.1 WXG100 family type VII secretion target [Kineothrix alysoides]